MVTAPNQVFFPSTFQELFTVWKRHPDAIPYAGGTAFIRDQEKLLPDLPQNIISLEKLQDLRRIARTERYLELGAMVHLSEILHLGKIVPEVLLKTIEGIAGIHVRNMATIGGNLCDRRRRLDTSAPLAALDAQFELRSAASSRWISATRFSTPFPPALSGQELLTRIRIPLEPWNFSRYRKFKFPGSNEHGSVIIFILRSEKDILLDLRIAYSGNYLLQNRQSRTPLMGKRLPLGRKEAQAFYDDWKKYLDNLETLRDPTDLSAKDRNQSEKAIKIKNDLLNAQILNFIEDTISDFTD